MKTALSLLLLGALTGAATGTFRKKYIHVAQHVNWTDAKAYCMTNYFDLMIVNTQEEYDNFILDSAASSTDRCWIGLSKMKEELAYSYWSDGSPLELLKWRVGEPMNLNTEHCITTTTGLWSDHGCDNLHNFYCYTWWPELVVVQEKKTWEEALEHCRTFYGDLVSLKTQTDLMLSNKFLANMQTTPFWTGLHFLDGFWFWINETVPVNVTSLLPCPTSPYRCGAKTGAVRFENRNCSEKMFFICHGTEGLI